MSDPEKLPGLAHFCEHMLFLGTEKVKAFINRSFTAVSDGFVLFTLLGHWCVLFETNMPDLFESWYFKNI